MRLIYIIGLLTVMRLRVLYGAAGLWYGQGAECAAMFGGGLSRITCGRSTAVSGKFLPCI